MSHYTTMHATVNYPAPPPSSSVALPLPYLPPPLFLSPLFPPPQPAAAVAAASSDSSFQSRISPSVLLIILILAVIFFVSGLLHLLVRFLLRPLPRGPRDSRGGGDSSHATTAFQGQLQQLFHLHDAGVDQSFIDALPVFLYGAVVGAGRKDPFDCAVCLCEFADDDRLRLLPKCSHAFHVECIDTWLLSHSTCPLCRRSLLADFSPCGGACSPLVFVLESGSEGSVVSDCLDAASSTRLSFVMEQEEETGQQDRKHAATEPAAEKKDEVVVSVKLGKFRSHPVAGVAEGGGGDRGQDVRRCFSMGTYEYVMDDSSLLRVAVKPPPKKLSSTRVPGHRVAMSECDCHSKREGFRGFDAPPSKAVDKRESFSISKIWMRGGAPRRKDGATSSRRASSFRLSSSSSVLQGTASDVGAAVLKPHRADAVSVSPVTESEYNVSAWDKSASASVVDWDLESAGTGRRLSSRADEAPSFARRTLLWIRGHL